MGQCIRVVLFLGSFSFSSLGRSSSQRLLRLQWPPPQNANLARYCVSGSTTLVPGGLLTVLLKYSDTTLNYNNFNEAVKQWTNVLGYSQTPSSTQQNSPLSGWTRYTYGPSFQAISAQGVSHNIPVQEKDVLAWFGITSTSNPTTTTSPTTTTPTTTTTTTPGGGTGAAHWGQCGG